MAGMFDDVEKELASAPKPVAKPGLFDDIHAALSGPAKAAPKPGLFDDLHSGSVQINAGVPPNTSEASASPEASLGSRVASVKEAVTPAAMPEKDPTRMMEFLGLDKNNPRDVAIAQKMQVGSLEHTLNQTLAKTADFISKWTGLDRSKQFFADKAEEAVVPGSPLTTVVKGAPAVAGQTLAEIGRGAIPSSLMDLGLLFGFGGSEKLDEALALGYNNVAKTAPQATQQLIRSMMEVSDPVVRANLLKKSAPVLLGRTVADEVVGLAPGKIGVHPPDATVAKVLGDLGEHGPDIFKRGLESFPDKELQLFGGKRLANQVKELLVKSEGKPELFQELVGNFTPAQQRLITRRGLGTVDFQTPPKNYKLSFEESQANVDVSRRAELLPPVVRESKTPEVLYHGTLNDIKGGLKNPVFLGEKTETSQFYAEQNGEGTVYPVRADIRKPLEIFDEAGAKKFVDIARKAGVKVDFTPSTPGGGGWSFESKEISKHSPYEGNNINDLMYIPKVRAQLQKEGFDGIHAWDTIETSDHKIWVPADAAQTKLPRTVSEADALLGKQKIVKAIKDLNQPFQLTVDQQDVARSLAVRENQLAVNDTIATKGASQPMPNLEKVEAVLAARAPRSQPLQVLQESGQKLYNDTRNLLEFEPQLKAYPQFRQELESLQSYRLQASRESTALIGATVEVLDTNREFTIFSKLVVLNDFKDALESGATKVAGNLTKEEVNLAVAKWSAQATGPVLEALERHYEIVQAMGQDLVRRGYMEPEMLKDKYFRHNVLKYLDEELGGDPGAMGKRGTAPFRTYVLGRVDNAALIDTDYINVMHKLYTKVKIDNQLEDFIRAQATKLDHTPTLSDEARLSFFGEAGSPRVAQRYVIDGKNYMGYRYFPKNSIYGTSRQAEKIITDALENSLDPAELDQRLAGVNQRLENQKVYLLPEETADALKRLNQPQQLAHIYALIKNSTRLWKRTTLAGAGLPWQMANFTGSLEALYREGDFGAIASIPESLIRLGKAQLNPQELEPLIQKAIDAHLINPPGQGLLPQDAPELLRFMDNPERFKAALKAPLKFYETLTQASVGSPKFAKFMADTARIQRGEAVVTKTFGPELAGLTAEQQVLQANRLTLVEFAVNNPKFNSMFRDFMFPFASFYYNNTKGWAKYLARNPTDAIVKFGVPYAAMQYWNWSRFPEVEKQLEPWRRYQPHVITGKLDSRGRHILVTYSSIGQEAAKWVAGDELLYRVGQVAKGELSMADAASDQLHATLKAPAEMGWNLLNPLVSAMVDIGVNKQKPSAGGGAIVPDRLIGTRQGLDLQHQHLLQNLVTPLSTFYRTEAKEEASPVNPLLRFFKYGPFDVERAAGIKHVDLNSAERSLRYARGEEGKVLNNQNFADLEDAYVRSQVTGDGTAYDNALDRLQSKIYLPPGRDLASFLKSPRVSIRIKKEQLQRAGSEGERQQLINDIQELKDGQSLKSVKSAPRQERAYILDGSQAE